MIKLPLNVDYSGKVVVVTGAGGLICGAMARAFAQSGAKVAGCAIAVEKAFQQGGKRVRELGVRVESLAMVESMSDDSLTFVR